MTMTLEDLKEAMLHFERMNNEIGWEQIPELIVVNDEGVNFVGIGGPGDPVEALRYLPHFENIKVLIFIIEGWSYPRHVIDQFDSLESLAAYAKRQPPVEHPERIECRIVFGLTPEHEIGMRRIRGGDVEFEADGMERGGRVVEALRRMIRKPLEPPTFSEN